MRIFSLLGCIAAALTVSVWGDCGHDVDQCKATYEHGTAQGVDVDSYCKAANVFVTCLRDLGQRPDCAASNSTAQTIQNERRRAEEKLNERAPTCAHCTTETDTCLATFNANETAANSNVSAICNDGQNYVLCLRRTDQKPECFSEKSVIEKERRKAQEKLTQAGCDTGAACLAEIDKCQVAQKQATSAQNSRAQQCSVAQTYHNCLKMQEGAGKCLGAFVEELKFAIIIIEAEENAGNCSAIDTGNGGAASEHRPAAAVVLATLFLTVVALR